MINSYFVSGGTSVFFGVVYALAILAAWRDIKEIASRKVENAPVAWRKAAEREKTEPQGTGRTRVYLWLNY